MDLVASVITIKFFSETCGSVHVVSSLFYAEYVAHVLLTTHTLCDKAN